MIFTERLFDLPSVMAFLQKVSSDLAMGDSSILLLTDGLSVDDILGRLFGVLGGMSIRYHILSPRTRSPLETLIEEFGLEIDGRPTIEKIICSVWLPKVIVITDLHNHDVTKQQQWLTFISHWSIAASAHHQQNQQTSAITIVLPANHVTSNALLKGIKIWRWSDVLNDLEFRLMCYLESSMQEPKSKNRWREYVLPAISSLDIKLAGQLWNIVCQPSCSVPELMKHLCDYGQMWGWSAKDFQEIGGNFPENTLGDNTLQWYSRGMIYRNRDDQWEVHSALLALAGDNETIEFRFWSGQAALLLPELDQIRRRMINIIKLNKPENWHLDYKPDHASSDQFSVYDIEWWGIIEECADKHLKKLAHICRSVRNRIAHYQAVSYADYESISGIYQKLT